jgi:RIO kinase 1
MGEETNKNFEEGIDDCDIYSDCSNGDDDIAFSKFETVLNSLDHTNNIGGNFTSSNIDFGRKINLSTKVQNEIVRSEKKSNRAPNYQGRDDRATTEQVLDPRTRLILFKLLNNNFLSSIDGCLSTGKEANVYYANGGNGKEYAVKIFKTSILVFRDRDKYVSGEHRFRHGYCKSNPRKMVRTWAEKEMRNLKRLHAAGIPCPYPHLLKSHILIMDFLGKDGWCAPRLKDATLNTIETKESYLSICVNMRRMYHECNLVHGDLSEYNLLWHNRQIVVIDVSQSVENAHPFAIEFLRKDIRNISDFFSKKGMKVLTDFMLYNFITEKNLYDMRADLNIMTITYQQMSSLKINETAPIISNSYTSLYEYLSFLMESYHNYLDNYDENDVQHYDETNHERQMNEAVFLQSYVPSSLMEISNPHEELKKMNSGQRESIFTKLIQNMIVSENNDTGVYAKNNLGSEKEDIGSKVLGMDDSISQTNPKDAVVSVCGDDNDNEDDDEGDDDDDSQSDNDSDDENGNRNRRILPSRDDPEARIRAKAARKEACKLQKEQAAEKRKHKIPKHVKKRAMKAGKKK